ncbi:MAG: anthranilate phosphoribosyltransferase [Mariprofundales bacterium]|nr:anthranilate phosphoribosyltransferase [Mariprofundales bacterium]
MLGRVARGKHGRQHLSRNEAADALAALMQPQADPLQLGAFLIAQRIKGETPDELAGFVDAARHTIPDFGQFTHPNAVDLPCYAGKRRGAPIHLLAALQARDRGIPVFIHTLGTIAERLTAAETLLATGLQPAASLADADAQLQHDGIAWIEIADLCPPLAALLALRPRLGVRSCAHTIARLLNPLQCGGQLNGFFHAPYGERMAQVNRLLGQPRSLLFMGAEGEPELYADRQKLLLMQQGDQDSVPLCYPDANTDPYPRQASTAATLLEAWHHAQSGHGTPREQAVLTRMAQGFDEVAGGGMEFSRRGFTAEMRRAREKGACTVGRKPVGPV